MSNSIGIRSTFTAAAGTEEFKAFAIQLKLAELESANAHRSVADKPQVT
jgi:hypothetical protein